MGLVVATNLAMLSGRNHLVKASKNHNDAMKRLSSGLRINSAKDDAAGLAISDRIKTGIASQQQLKRNILDGMSYAQTGDAGLEEIQSLLQRGHELAVYAANGTLSDSDRQSLNQEFSQIKAQITDIANTTEIFGKYPLQQETGPPTIKDLFGSSGTTIPGVMSGVVSMSRIPKGSVNVVFTVNAIGADDDIQIFARDGKHLIGTDLSDFVWASKGLNTPGAVEAALFTSGNGYAAGARYDATLLNSGGVAYQNPPTHTTSYKGMNLTYSGDADRTDPADSNNDGFVSKPIETVRVDVVTEDLLVSVVGNGSFVPTASWGFMPDGTSLDPVKILIEKNPKGDQSYISIDKTPADAAALGIEGHVLDPEAAARSSLVALKEAMQKVSEQRGSYGAKLNALDVQQARVDRGVVVDNEVLSRILDADLAKEATALTKASLLRNASVAMLAQSYQQPQLLLSLLK